MKILPQVPKRVGLVSPYIALRDFLSKGYVFVRRFTVSQVNRIICTSGKYKYNLKITYSIGFLRLVTKEGKEVMKSCSKCNQKKKLEDFHKKSASVDGRTGICKTCRLSTEKIRYSNKSEEIKNRVTSYRKDNPDKVKKWQKTNYWNNREKQLERGKVYRKFNKDKIRAKDARYYKANKHKYIFHDANRRAIKLKATPSWSEKDRIATLYKKAKWLESLTGLKYHVDHIIPLNNPNVCRLHVWENLQILEKSLNLKKCNKF